MPPELQQVMANADALVLKAKGAVLSAARDIQKEILYLAGELNIAGSAEAREAVFAQVSKKVAKLNKRLSALFAYMDEMAVKKAGKAASDGTGIEVKISNAHAKEIISAVTRGGSARLAATMTRAMNDNIVAALRDATVSAFREQAVGGLTNAELKKVLLQKWKTVAKDPKNLQFVDKRGRVWDTDTYINMNVRTNAMNVYNDALVENIGKATGSDLVMVSRGGDPDCRLCFPWEGRILSITGKTKGFPTYDDAKRAGLFHPNCVHTLEPVDDELDADEINLQRQFPPPAEMTPKAMDDQRYEIDINRKMLSDGLSVEQAKIAVDRDNLTDAIRQGLIEEDAEKIVAKLTDEQVNALCPDGNPPKFEPVKNNDGVAEWNKGSNGGTLYIDKKALSTEKIVAVANVAAGKPVVKPEVKVAQPPKGESDEERLQRTMNEAKGRYDAWFEREASFETSALELGEAAQKYVDTVLDLRKQILDYAKEKGRDDNWARRNVPQYGKVGEISARAGEIIDGSSKLVQRISNELTAKVQGRFDALAGTNSSADVQKFIEFMGRTDAELDAAVKSVSDMKAKLERLRDDGLRDANAEIQAGLSVIDALVKREDGEQFKRNTLADIGIDTDEKKAELKTMPLSDALKKTSALNDGMDVAARQAEKQVAEVRNWQESERAKIREKYKAQLAELDDMIRSELKPEERTGDKTKFTFAERIERRKRFIQQNGLQRSFTRWMNANYERLYQYGDQYVRGTPNGGERATYTNEEVDKHNASLYRMFLYHRKDAVQRAWNKDYNALMEESALRRFDASVGGLFSIPEDRRGVTFYESPKSREEKARMMNDVVSRLVSRDMIPRKVVHIEPYRGRAYQSGDRIYLAGDDDVGTYIHEYAHFIEEHVPHAHKRCQQFLKMRCERDPEARVVRLKDVSGGRYSADEVCIKDRFFSPYCGKLYGHKKDENGMPKSNAAGDGYDVSATEILSMGLEKMYRDPKGFYDTDREYFDFVVNLVQGAL